MGPVDSTPSRLFWWVAVVLVFVVGVAIVVVSSTGDGTDTSDTGSAAATTSSIREPLTETTIVESTTEPATTTTGQITFGVPEERATTIAPLADPTSVMPPGVTLLVAHQGGIELWNAQGAIPMLTGVDVAVAFPDGAGGVIYQERLTTEQYANGASPPIMRITAPGSPPEVLVSSDWAIHLQNVAVSAGETLVAYSVLIPNPDFCPGEFCTTASENGYDLVLRNLSTGAERRVEAWAGWEYIAFAFDLGDQLVATHYSEYDVDPSCLGVFTLEQLLANPGGGPDLCPQHPEQCPDLGGSAECALHMSPPAIAPDDRAIAYLWSDGQGSRADVVVRDAMSLRELRRVAIETREYFFPRWPSSVDIATDGWIAVSGDACVDTVCVESVALVAPDGSVTQPFPAPWATIWTAP